MLRKFLRAGLSVLIWGVFAIAGDIAGNGGDNPPPEESSAWFLGEWPIRYCVAVAPDFGVGEAEAKKHVQASFETWREYMAKKRINDSTYMDGFGYNSGPSLLGESKLLGHSEETPGCDGTEEIAFFLGVENELVKKYRSEYYRPTAFAKRLVYDGLTGRSRGFVWVAKTGGLGDGTPNWNLPHRLRGILLHELGHVHGVGHLKGTIMQSNLGGLVLDSSGSAEFAESHFSRIDWDRELLFCERCGGEYAGDDELLNELPGGFELLVGRKPVGRIKAVFTDRRVEWFNEAYELRLRDALGEFTFVLGDQFGTMLSRVLGEIPVFKKALYSNRKVPRYMHDVALTTDGVSLLRSLVTKSGATIKVVLNRNMGSGAVHLHALETGQHLFVSERPKW